MFPQGEAAAAAAAAAEAKGHLDAAMCMFPRCPQTGIPLAVPVVYGVHPTTGKPLVVPVGYGDPRILAAFAWHEQQRAQPPHKNVRVRPNVFSANAFATTPCA